MSGPSASPPATPLKKYSELPMNSHSNFDYYTSPTSVTDSDGSSVDGDASAPATPAAHQFSPPGPQRRRSVTLSVMPNHMDSLHGHSIFKLAGMKSKNHAYNDVQVCGDDGSTIYLNENRPVLGRIVSEKEKEQPKHHVTFSPVVTTAPAMESQEHDVEVQDSTSDQSDALDLAKNGLPSACIFVAKQVTFLDLASSQTDEQLLASVQAHFEKFGRVHVKIRRDSKGNPYSFCQFENDEIARTAVREGRHAVIDPTGRRIRCEPAKVNRTLVLGRRDEALFDREEAEKALFGYGSLEAVEFTAGIGQPPSRGIDSGKRCYARFVYRQDAVDCYQYFRCHAIWAADWTHNHPTVQLVPVPRIQVEEIDRQSVFVGKLNPGKTTETLLRQRFEKHGPISEVHLLSKHKNGVGRIAFAFIKYGSEDDAFKAIEKENNTEFLGNIIHVQQREIHKKSLNSAHLHHDNPQSTVYSHVWANSQLPHHPMTGPVMLNLRDVADLAAKLSYQLDFKRNQANHARNQSIASQDSRKGYGVAADRGSTLHRRDNLHSNNSNPTDLRFRHPFLIPAGFGNPTYPPFAPEQQLSPRSANATLQKSATYQNSNVGDASAAGYYEPTWQTIFPGYYSAIPTQMTTGVHPYQHDRQVQYLHPGYLMQNYNSDMSRRSSMTSVGYDTPVGMNSPPPPVQGTRPPPSQ